MIFLSPATSNYMQHCFERAQINYRQQYLWLYITFSCWYQKKFGVINDRLAIERLKQASYDGRPDRRRTNAGQQYWLRCLSDYSQAYPLQRTKYWNGTVTNWYDWPGILEYWYMTRCSLMHGAEISDSQAELSFQTLYQFVAQLLASKPRSISLPFHQTSV